MTATLIIIIVLVIVAIAIISRGLRIVPQQHAWVVERLGRYHQTLGAGLNLIVPLVDRVAYRFDLRETPIDVAEQICITKDNTQILIDGVLYLQITDPRAAAYGTSDPLMSVVQLAQTVMRSDVGKTQLDDVLSTRSELNKSIVSELDQAAINWGVKVLRYEIRDIRPPEEIVRAMELQITAERQKRAVIAKSEGDKQQAINVSEGARQQHINLAEGERQAQVLRAQGEAQAIMTVAGATAKALATVGTSLQKEGGLDAMKMQVAQDFIERWGGIAKSSNVMIVPADMGDLSKVIGTAFTIVDGVKTPVSNRASSPAPSPS